MRTILQVLAALTLVAALDTPAQAQFYRRPYDRHYGGYGGYGGWGWGGPYYNPYSGNLYGSAAIINAQGKMMLDTQKAYMQKEKILQEKQVTRRKAIDEYLYEQRVLPTPEEKREKSRQEQLMRARNDPPLTEIWSGKALNDLLVDIQRLSAVPAYVQTMPVDQQILQHINVTTGQTSGSVGVLDNLQNLNWPLALTTSDFDSDRTKTETLIKDAVSQAQSNRVDPNTLRGLIDSIDKMTQRLRGKIASVSSTQYVRAKRFLSELEDSTKVLQEPNVGKYFSDWKPKGNDVAELVNWMTGKGLRFAPASSGDQTYYTALHRLLSNYDVALSHQTSSAALFQSGNKKNMLLPPSPGDPSSQPPVPFPPKPPLPKPPGR